MATHEQLTYRKIAFLRIVSKKYPSHHYHFHVNVKQTQILSWEHQEVKGVLSCSLLVHRNQHEEKAISSA